MRSFSVVRPPGAWQAAPTRPDPIAPCRMRIQAIIGLRDPSALVFSARAMDRIAIRIYGLDDALTAAEAAADLGCPLALISAPGAGYWAGPLWFKALIEEVRKRHPELAMSATLDCSDFAGAVLAAVRARVPRILFTGDDATADRLAPMAEAAGLTLLTRQPRVADPRNSPGTATFWRSTLLDQ